MSSFAHQVKQELSESNNYKKKDLLKAQLLGYVLSANCVKKDNSYEYITENEYNIEAFYKILFNLKIDYEPLVRSKTYVAQIIDIEKINDLMELLNSSNIDIRKSVLKGAFLGSGSINEPSKQSHLEILFGSEKEADIIKEIANSCDIDFKIIKKQNNKYLLYLKSNEQISNFLATIGSNKGVLLFEDALVMRNVKNSINRKVNCETANLAKTVDASFNQINDIKLIQKKNEFDTMEQSLKELAMLRLNNPDLSLKELGELLNPPLGKSGVSHRMKRIHEEAERLRIK